MIKKIIQAAVALGACSKSGEATDWRSLAWLLFSPQGREFCEKHQFPSVTMWSEIKRECDTEKYGVFVDAGYIHIHDRENTALIGQTYATLHFSKPESVHRVIVMHGAKATLKLRNYAVVNLVKVGTDTEVTIDKDETSVVLW